MFSSPILIRLLSGSNESIVIENGARYLMINSPFYMILGMLLNFRFALQGIGEKIVPVISSVIEFIGKIIFAFLLVPILGYFGVIICEPIIWFIMFIQLCYSFYTNPYIRGKSIEYKETVKYTFIEALHIRSSAVKNAKNLLAAWLKNNSRNTETTR